MAYVEFCLKYGHRSALYGMISSHFSLFQIKQVGLYSWYTIRVLYCTSTILYCVDWADTELTRFEQSE